MYNRPDRKNAINHCINSATKKELECLPADNQIVTEEPNKP